METALYFIDGGLACNDLVTGSCRNCQETFAQHLLEQGLCISCFEKIFEQESPALLLWIREQNYSACHGA